ncbi:hypothetical protein DRE_06297 [Drechslerella stenobrocha 248]|uniref:Uncharacterized protein n=1 Tax=Drechslerella stenobrocha 248 TaxID=1043628 RepID=W7HY11_9PEZI|nr:hypothetical protein DRE_06297 [Drechslerella stenobrocha 248]
MAGRDPRIRGTCIVPDSNLGTSPHRPTSSTSRRAVKSHPSTPSKKEYLPDRPVTEASRPTLTSPPRSAAGLRAGSGLDKATTVTVNILRSDPLQASLRNQKVSAVDPGHLGRTGFNENHQAVFKHSANRTHITDQNTPPPRDLSATANISNKVLGTNENAGFPKKVWGAPGKGKEVKPKAPSKLPSGPSDPILYSSDEDKRECEDEEEAKGGFYLQSPHRSPQAERLDRSWDYLDPEAGFPLSILSSNSGTGDLQTEGNNMAYLYENTNNNPDQPSLAAGIKTAQLCADYDSEQDSIKTEDYQLAIIASPPKPLAFFSEIAVQQTYKALNFDFQRFFNPILEVADVYLPRTAYYDKIALESPESWFSAPTIGKQYMIRRVKKLSPSGWSDVWIDPNHFIADFCFNLQCNEDDIEHVWVGYGIDIFKFIQTQWALRSTPYSFKPGAIDITSGPHKEGCNMYLLTCLLLQNGQFEIRYYPPQVLIAMSVSAAKVTEDTPWLEWDSWETRFQGRIPDPDDLAASDDGRICVIITGSYNLKIGKTKTRLHESLTTRLYVTVPRPQEDRVKIETDRPSYPTNPQSFLWSSHALGFEKTHSDCSIQKATIETGLLGSYNGNFVARVPQGLRSLGPARWDELLIERRKRERQTQQGSGEGSTRFMEDRVLHDDKVESDNHLDDMRRRYETQLNEAVALVWLNTTYRESLQERLWDESHDECGFPCIIDPALTGKAE